jgi:salicylate hydroxylase
LRIEGLLSNLTDHEEERQTMRIAIIGGGIAGATAALALQRTGHEAHVFEQARALSEVGAGVTIHPNGMRVLHRLGVGDAVVESGAAHRESFLRDASGALLRKERDAGTGLHRADLLGLLVGRLAAGSVHVDHRLLGVEDRDDSAIVRFQNGRSMSADVVIGADGIHSMVRQSVIGDEDGAPRFSGTAAYRGLIPAQRVPGWPAETVQMWLGERSLLRVYPVRGGELLNFIAVVPAGEEFGESWSARGDVAELRRRFERFDPTVGDLFEQADQTDVFGLRDRLPLPRWSRGRVTLAGDAAHPMLPSMGQGANQAIEDAMAVATLLRDATVDEVPELLVRYQAVRHGHTARIQRRCWRIGMDVLGQDDPRLPAVDDTVTVAWAYDHDVEFEALAVR